jgi:hypothetical protein
MLIEISLLVSQSFFSADRYLLLVFVAEFLVVEVEVKLEHMSVGVDFLQDANCQHRFNLQSIVSAHNNLLQGTDIWSFSALGRFSW